MVDVTTDQVTFTVAPDQLLGTPDGWVHARDAEGTVLAWTQARKLRRERLTIKPGYEFGYMLGANCSDGTVGKNYVSLVVNDRAFAARFARSLTAATGLPARLEAVTRPSGYLQRDAPGFRVRVVSSYLADLMRQYVVHTAEQRSGLTSGRGRQLGGTGHVQARAASPAVGRVRVGRSASPKPFTLYGYRLDPYPGFLVNGHLARQPW